MKRALLFCFGMIGIMSLVSFIEGAPKTKHFPYFREIKVRADEGVLASSDLDDHIHSYSNFEYSNSILIDENGELVPFSIRPKRNRNMRFYDVPVLVQRRSSRRLETGGVEVIYRKRQKSADPTTIRLELDAPLYEAQVSVWGSQDAVNWKELSEGVLIFNYPEPIKASNNSITIDARKINYYKVSITPLSESDESPYVMLAQDSVVSAAALDFKINVKDIRFYQTKSGINSDVIVTQEYKFSRQRVRKYQNNSQFILASGRQPIHTILIESKTPYFSRPVVIQGRINQNDWKTLYQGHISQIQHNGTIYSHTRIPLGRLYRFDDYVVMIGDSTRSLDISQISAEGHTLELVYHNPSHTSLRFYYGGNTVGDRGVSETTISEGDFSNIIQDMQAEKLNPSYTGVHDLSVQYVVKQRGFLLFAGGSIAILIILFLSNRSKK